MCVFEREREHARERERERERDLKDLLDTGSLITTHGGYNVLS